MIFTLNRRILGKIPSKKTESIIERLSKLEPASLTAGLPVVWKKAKGHSVWDIDGNKYIDFTSTIFVTNPGHCAVYNAVKNQAKRLIHSYTYPNLPRLNLVQKLIWSCPITAKEPCKVYLASSGSEVTDWAIKLMRNHFKNSKKSVIISFEGGFHGKVGEAAKLENQELRLPLPKTDKDWETHKKLIDKYKNKCCGIMIESYQGWSAEFFPKKYIQHLIKYCKENNILVCFDEIQGGFYRTGYKFAYEHYENHAGQCIPDLMCLGKALGGGLPISALVGRSCLFTMDHMSSTHSANPLCCAAALESLRIMDKISKSFNFELNTSYLKGYLKILTTTYKIKLNGNGFLYGLIFKNKKIADEICYECMRNGLLVVRTGRESIKLGPPLSISHSALKEGVKILNGSIKKVLSNGQS